MKFEEFSAKVKAQKDLIQDVETQTKELKQLEYDFNKGEWDTAIEGIMQYKDMIFATHGCYDRGNLRVYGHIYYDRHQIFQDHPFGEHKPTPFRNEEWQLSFANEWNYGYLENDLQSIIADDLEIKETETHEKYQSTKKELECNGYI